MLCALCVLEKAMRVKTRAASCLVAAQLQFGDRLCAPAALVDVFGIALRAIGFIEHAPAIIAGRGIGDNGQQRQHQAKPHFFAISAIFLLTPLRPSWASALRGRNTPVGPALRGGGWVGVPMASPLPPAPCTRPQEC